jgi:hypothetical protein
MTHSHLTNEQWDQLNERIKNDPEYAKALLKKILPAPKRMLEGKERENILLLMKIVGPVAKSNNQRFWYEKYVIGSKVYTVTYGVEDQPIIEEHLNETNL